MLHTYVVRFDVTGNFKFFCHFLQAEGEERAHACSLVIPTTLVCTVLVQP